MGEMRKAPGETAVQGSPRCRRIVNPSRELGKEPGALPQRGTTWGPADGYPPLS